LHSSRPGVNDLANVFGVNHLANVFGVNDLAIVFGVLQSNLGVCQQAWWVHLDTPCV
jgi:hypothetical protein